MNLDRASEMNEPAKPITAAIDELPFELAEGAHKILVINKIDLVDGISRTTVAGCALVARPAGNQDGLSTQKRPGTSEIARVRNRDVANCRPGGGQSTGGRVASENRIAIPCA